APPVVILTAVPVMVLDFTRQERAALLELPKHVPTKRAVRSEPLASVLGERPAHARPDERKILRRPEEGGPLQELPLLPEETVELRRRVAAETAPEDEVLWRRDRRDRVELEEPERADGVENARRGAVEELRAKRDAACFLGRDDRHARQPSDGPGVGRRRLRHCLRGRKPRSPRSSAPTPPFTIDAAWMGEM